MKLLNNYNHNPVILFIIGLFFLSCSKDGIPEEEIIAKVGNRIITVKEFTDSFEFSLQTLRSGKNPRKEYLNYMINELLIANEGYAKGYNKNKYVTNRIKTRTKNDLLQSFYSKYVHSKVNVPDEEIEDALKKASIKFRLLIYPTQTLSEAAGVYDAAQKTDLGEYIDKKITNLEIKNITRKNFETDWVDYLDMPPEIFNEIKDLEFEKPSKPIAYQNGYAIFQVISLNREMIKSDELKYGAKRKKMYARLFNIQSDKIVHNVMDSILTPLDVHVSNEVVDKMVEPLLNWIQAGLPDRGSLVKNLQSVTDTSASYLNELKKLLQQKLYTSKDGDKTVEDYLEYMNYYRKNIKQSQNYVDLKNRLLTEIGTMIKNNKFMEIAKDDGYLDSASVKEDIGLWEEKWTYDIYRAQLTKDIEITNEEMQKFFKERWKELKIANVDTTRFYKYENDVYNFLKFEKHMAQLHKDLDTLKSKYNVWINEEVLNKIKLNDDPKSSETSVFVIKNFSGEQLVPTVDPTWVTY